MLLIKFRKVGTFAYISYLDCRDVIIQTIKRAGIEFSYSQGFNPHELIYFTPPTSLGIESFCEYVYIVTDYNDIDNFVLKFNELSPKGLKVDWVKNIDKKPNFYDLIDCAKYIIKLSKPLQVDFSKIDLVGVDLEFADKVFNISYINNEIHCILACGQKNNLKPSKLISHLQTIENFEVIKIIKMNLYNSKDKNNLIDIDMLL